MINVKYSYGLEYNLIK